jgi:hypothetical protein
MMMPVQKSLLCRTAIGIIALMLLIPAAQLAAQSSSENYVVVGTETTMSENVTEARKLAITNGLVTAVGLAVAGALSVENMVAQYETLNQTVFNNPGRFIQDYKVLTESSLEKGYRVVVQASVDQNQIKNELIRSGVLLTQKRMPAVLFFIVEQNLENPFPQYWWGRNMPFAKSVAETAMAEIMQDKGFRIVEHGPQVQLMARQSVPDAPQVTVSEAIELGKALRADVVVLGRAVANNAPNMMGSDLRSFKGGIISRAYIVTTGEEVTAVDKTAVTANADIIAGGREALSAAGKLAGEQLAIQMAAAWQKEGMATGKVDIQLTGTGNLANFVQFRRMLTDLSGVEDVQVKELKADDATLRIAYRGKTRELADTMMVQSFETFGINIYDISDNRLSVQLVPYAPGSSQPQ